MKPLSGEGSSTTRTDAGSLLLSTTISAFGRRPFTVPDPLRMRFSFIHKSSPGFNVAPLQKMVPDGVGTLSGTSITIASIRTFFWGEKISSSLLLSGPSLSGRIWITNSVFVTELLRVHCIQGAFFDGSGRSGGPVAVTICGWGSGPPRWYLNRNSDGCTSSGLTVNLT